MSQGYLKLYVDGRLATPEDQQRALRQTREALGVIAVLCADMTRVSALAEAGLPALAERLQADALARELKAAPELAAVPWHESSLPAAGIATNAPKDLVRAMAVVIKCALDESPSAPRAVQISSQGDALLIRAGSEDALAVLSPSPEGAGAAPVNVARGGKGLSLIWATFVADQHRIQMWNHQAHKASVGLRIPLVSV